jgi:hypothetical protein
MLWLSPDLNSIADWLLKGSFGALLLKLLSWLGDLAKGFFQQKLKASDERRDEQRKIAAESRDEARKAAERCRAEEAALKERQEAQLKLFETDQSTLLFLSESVKRADTDQSLLLALRAIRDLIDSRADYLGVAENVEFTRKFCNEMQLNKLRLNQYPKEIWNSVKESVEMLRLPSPQQR